MNSIEGVEFTDAPSEIEGSPFWVDKWSLVNGYRIGIQVKPRSYASSSLSIYAGAAKSGMKRGHKKFQGNFGGKVFTIVLENGEVIDSNKRREIIDEIRRLQELSEGPHQ
ncbi:MAG: hypothetical protein ACJ0HH_03685 [Candidatus Thalassarchaeum sp.]